MKYVMAILTALAVLVMSRWLMGNRDEAEHEQLLPDGTKPDLESPRPIAERGTDAAAPDEADEGAAARPGSGTDAADVVKSGDAVELEAEATDDATPAGEDAFRDMKEAEADAAAEEEAGDADGDEEAGDAQEEAGDEAAAQEEAGDADDDEAATDQDVEEAASETSADETDAVADADQADDGAGEGEAADTEAEDAAGDEAGDEQAADTGAEDAAGAEDTEDEPPFGEGSAHAAEDGSGPEGWEVKGNSDSMLYHTPDSPYYERTKAEVWFESEDAADDAGFRRWEDDASDDDAAADAGDDSATSDETATEEDGDGSVEGPYGPGSAASAEDGSGPEGWAVKGNADSMLYHTPDSHSFEQTKAEVWFESEEAAQAAGFKRWDHRQQ